MRITIIILGLLVAFTAASPSRARAGDNSVKTPMSISAKLYWAAKLMDNHDNWLKVSELMREILQEDLDNDYVRARITRVKKYVDREWARRGLGSFAGSRLDDHSFLEVRLLIVECIQELRPRLNKSWTGEVRHLKKMLFTSLFPHAEEYTEVEFPDPKTYAFSTYGYTLKNIRALLIGRGGESLHPEFSLFIDKEEKKTQEDAEWDGGNFSYKKLTSLKDRVYSDLMAEGVDPNKVAPEEKAWDPQRDDSSWDQDGDFGGWGGDDWYWGPRDGIEARIFSLKKIYSLLVNVVTMMRNHHSIDEYEPLTLLWVATSNPGLIEADPQLRDFVAGLKFKVKVAQEGSDGTHFSPRDYELVKTFNDALTPDANVRLKFEVDRTSLQAVLYVISNVNGSTNIVSNIISIRNYVALVKAIRSLPTPVLDFAKNTPENLAKLTELLNKWIESMNTSGFWVYRFLGNWARPMFDVATVVGGKSLTWGATKTVNFIKKIAEQPRVQRFTRVAGSDKLIHILIGVAVAADLTAGTIEYLNTNDKEYQGPKIIVHTAARASSSLIYLLRYKPVVFGAAILDFGHLLYDKIPSVSDVFQDVLSYGYNRIHYFKTGLSPLEDQLKKMKGQLGYEEDGKESVAMLTDYERRIQDAKSLEDLNSAKKILAERIGLYAAKRMVFHYLAVSMLNGKGERDLGYELRRQSHEYDRLHWTWFYPPGGKIKEQAGLRALDVRFDQKWVMLGGKIPERPKPEPEKKEPKKGEKKDKKDDDDSIPWEDLQK